MLNKIAFLTFLFRLITYLLEKISTRNYRELSLPLLFHFPLTHFLENSPIIPLYPPPPPPKKNALLKRRRYKKRKKNCIGFALLHSVTGLENSQNPHKQSDVTLEAIHGLVTSVFAHVEQITCLLLYCVKSLVYCHIMSNHLSI